MSTWQCGPLVGKRLVAVYWCPAGVHRSLRAGDLSFGLCPIELCQDVTRLLQAAGAQDRVAADQLLTLVYDQLRKIAQQRMSAERAGHTFEATALVHEAYLRLVGGTEVQWQGRAASDGRTHLERADLRYD